MERELLLARIQAPTGDGLICGFRLAPAEPVGAGAPEDGDERPLWLHFNLSDRRAHAYVERAQKLPEFAKESLLGRDDRIRAETSGQGVALVLGDLFHDFDLDPERFGTLRIFFDEHRIITGRKHPLMTIDRVRREVSHGLELDSPVAVFEYFLKALADTFAEIVVNLGEKVDDMEDKILGGAFQGKSTGIARARRVMARLRRLVTADRSALAGLRLPSFCDAEQRQSLSEIIERFDAIAQDLELVQERARLLQEEIAGRYSEATNRNLYLLSIVTVTLLPITLITGIFGMNVAGLPGTESRYGFAAVMALMGIGVVVALALLHWRRVL